MKTAEVTRAKAGSATGASRSSTFGLFMEIWKQDGLRGINKGVNAVALRQVRTSLSRYLDLLDR